MTQGPIIGVAHWALVIGINHYSNPEENLQGCVNDANLMKRYLELSIGTKLNVVSLTSTLPPTLPGPPTEDLQSLPTFENVVAHLQRITNQAKRGDRVFIYFAGHGAYISADSTPALVLLSSNGIEKQYFRLNALYKRVEPMIAEGLVVTIVLDCCFSGAIVRGDDREDIKVRGLDFDPTVTISVGPALEISGTTRDTAMEYDWHRYTTGFVVLCACAPDERTFEIPLDGKVQGLFTYHLLYALTILATNGISVTHATVHERLSTGLHAYWPRQTPMRYGKVDDVLFGESLLAPGRSSIPVYKDDNRQLRLRAGQLHGIVKGDEFYASAQDDGKTAHGQANVRATLVRAVDSDLEVIDECFENATVRVWKAEPLSTLSPKFISVGIPNDLNKNIQATDPETLRYLRIIETESTSQNEYGEPCLYNVRVNVNDQYEVLDVFPIPTIQRSSNDAAKQIVRILRHIADFKYFEGVENRRPCSRLQAALQIECDISPGSSNKIDVMHGDKITFSFVNTGSENLYFGVFDFGPLWQMDAVTKKGFIVLPARRHDKNGTARVILRMRVPDHFSRASLQCCEDHIKFLVTNTPTHFYWSLPAILDSLQPSGDSHRSSNEDLHTSLTSFLSDIRGHQEGEWTTQSYIVRTNLGKDIHSS
jgi:uncharacterized caspase-like protein